jgi:sugar phosphate isomerase/epimerase
MRHGVTADMRFAICNELFQGWPLERIFSFAREVGYEGIELAPFTLARSVAELPSKHRAEIRRRAEAEGLEVVGLHWLLAGTRGCHLTSADRAVQEKTAECLIELVRLCADLGGQVMVLGSPQQRNLLPGMSRDEAMQHAARTITRVVPTLENCGVTLAVEPLGPSETDFLVTADEALDLIRMVLAPLVRLQLDVKAMASESRPIPEIIRACAEHLAHFHANDPNRRGPGMGTVDFVPILQALKDAHYQGWLSVEAFDDAPGAEVVARESLGYLKECLHSVT